MTFVPMKKKSSPKQSGSIAPISVLQDILAKKPQEINEDDVNAVHQQSFISKSRILYDIVQQYYENLYGTKPAPQDEFGKLYVNEPTEDKKSAALNDFLKSLKNAFSDEEEQQKKKKKKDEEDDDDDDLDEDGDPDLPGEEKFIWQGEGCGECAQYDGQEFSIGAIPETHPNCKCELISNQNPDKIIKPQFDYDKYHREKAEREAQKEAERKAQKEAEAKQNKQESSEEDEKLLDEVKKVIKKEEGYIKHPYLDTKGNITTGYGSNLDNKEKFMETKWQVDGRPATDEEKEQGYKVFEEVKAKGQFGQKIEADDYQDKTNLRIDNKEAERMMDQHLREDLKGIKKEIPDFDNQPPQLKEVSLDMKYNTGNVSPKKWPKFHEGIANKDIEKVAANVNRKDVGQSRNDWAKNRISSIEKW